MKHESILHGTGATFVVTMAGAEDFGLKLGTSVLVAVLSTIVAHFVKKLLDRKSTNYADKP